MSGLTALHCLKSLVCLLSQLVEMSGTGRDLSLDWISRTLYVVENSDERGASSIMGYHMDQALYTQVIGSKDRSIGAVISDPYTRSV